jgi:hypothetical protein
MSDELLTAAEVSGILKVSKDTVLRHAKELGGVCISGNEGSLKRRRYRTMRFPKSQVETFLSKRAGHTVVVQTIKFKESRSRGQSSSHDGVRESNRNSSTENAPLSRQQANELAQECGFASASSMARHLVWDGWSPEAVEWKTGLPEEQVEKHFRAQPDRYKQWY